jgi:hypothetical protein
VERKVEDKELELVRRLVERLEHLSVDSTYAHRASGLRGSLLRYIERLEGGEQLNSEDQSRLDELTGYGFEIIELAAKEIGAKRK